MSIEAMKQALEALESCYSSKTSMHRSFSETKVNSSITSLRQAIAEAEKQEPVAWVETHDNGEVNWGVETVISDDPSWLDRPMPVYTAPPQRQWVGLTDADLERLKLLTFEKELNAEGEEQEAVNLNQLMRATEQLCKEKNNG